MKKPLCFYLQKGFLFGFYARLKTLFYNKSCVFRLAAFATFPLAAYPYAFLLAHDAFRLLCKLIYRKVASLSETTKRL